MRAYARVYFVFFVCRVDGSMHVYALSCAEDKEVKDAIKIMRHALEQSMRCGRWGIRPSYSSLEESRELALSLLSLLQTCKLPRELYIYIYIYSYICEEKEKKKCTCARAMRSGVDSRDLASRSLIRRMARNAFVRDSASARRARTTLN